MSYSELLKSPYWQRKRLEIMQRDDFHCRYCGSGSNTLNVHHLIYLPDHKPWDYKDELLITLCEPCHKEEEEMKKEDGLLLAQFLSIGLSRRQLYPLSLELRRHMEVIDTRQKKFIDIMDYLYG